jgi:hypothetical protein
LEILTTPNLAHGAGGRPRGPLCRFPTQPQLARAATTTRCADFATPGLTLPATAGAPSRTGTPRRSVLPVRAARSQPPSRA